MGNPSRNWDLSGGVERFGMWRGQDTSHGMDLGLKGSQGLSRKTQENCSPNPALLLPSSSYFPALHPNFFSSL